MKVILITGASTGIGFEASKQLMRKGMKVYAASRRGSISDPLTLSDKKTSGEIIPVKMDVNKTGDVQAAISRIMNENGRLDAVICNAGNGMAGSVEDTSEDEMRYQLETNFFGAVKTIQACLPIFREQGSGKILAVSSVAAIVPIPFQAFYSAGKSALSIFMQSLSLEVKPYNIQTCTVLLGDTKTNFTSARVFTRKSQLETSVYYKTMKSSVGKMEKDEQNGMSAVFVAEKIVRQVLRKRMKITIIPGLQYKVICRLYPVLPAKFRLWVVGLLYS